MSKKIEWVRTKSAPDQDEISRIEEYFGVRFPQEYLNCAKTNNGGHPSPDCFGFGMEQNSISYLHLLSHDDDYGIVKSYEAAKGIMPDGIVPFADDPFGNMICFDYRESKSNPKIVFWDYEKACIELEKTDGDYTKALKYICESFSDFIDMLHEYEEE